MVCHALPIRKLDIIILNFPFLLWGYQPGRSSSNLSCITNIWLIKAEKQAAHKHLMADIYNDPEHSEPFDITFPVPADRKVQVWIFETVVDQLSIIAQEHTFQSTHSLYFQVLYCFLDLQTTELFISSLVLMKESWSSNCCNYQVFLPYMVTNHQVF